MGVNLDSISEIYKTIDSNNYRAFLGKINKMSFSDYKSDHLILLEYKEPSKVLYILYKARKSFFVIKVMSDIDFDENIIKIFDLK